MSFKTFRDFTAAGDKTAFISDVIAEHKVSAQYITAVEADEYDRQRNTTICNFVQTIMTNTGSRIIDVTSANNKIACSFFYRLNMRDSAAQRMHEALTMHKKLKIKKSP